MGSVRRRASFVAAVLFFASLCAVDSRSAAAGSFLETFTGAPAMPTPWHPVNWDVTVHSRDVATFTSLETMHAGHGTDCSAPPATHDISSYEDAVFLCRDHMMTAINAAGYGVIYVTPDQLVDFASGEAVVRFDLSTARTSLRDWIDVWITPFEDNVQLVGDIGPVDLNGLPRRGVQVRMDAWNNGTIFRGFIVRDFNDQLIGSNDALALASIVTPSAAVRTTFELRISRTHMKFGIPALNAWWVDNSFADLGWSSGVLQLGHHSYNPEKGDGCGPPPCVANTWHWDNVSIAPATPFALLNADRRVATSGSSTVAFAAAAPANARLRFTGIGRDLAVSYDGGASWTPAALQAFEQLLGDEHFRSYWMPVPAGTSSVTFRGTNWFGGAWRVQNIGIWAAGASSPSATTPPPTAPPATAPPPSAGPSTSPTAPPGGGAPTPTPAPTPPPVAVRPPVPSAGFSASWLSQSAYPVLAPGQVGLVSLRFTNTGSEAWRVGVPGQQVNLGVALDSTEFTALGMNVGWLSANRLATTTEPVVAPGAVGTFTFQVRAPATIGVYRIDLRPVVDGVRWLEDQGVFLVVTSDLALHSEWVTQSAWPVLRPGELSAPITLVFRNTGTRSWVRGVAGQQVNLGIAGDDRSWAALGVGWPSPDRVATQSEAVVVPGGLASFEFRIQAPAAPGDYVLRLRPVVDGVSWLEDQGVFIQLTVQP